ncbi:MAG: class B sortase [Oscillospiraceae bacterium]|nr:class B sortase [Oscillospiraceae bacterium]
MTSRRKKLMTGMISAVLMTASVSVYLSSAVGAETADAPALTVSGEKVSSETVSLTIAQGPFGTPNGESGMSKSMRQYNSDSVGWIRIAGTKVNNPLVQCEDNDFYLSMGFNHQPYRAGTVFMDYRNLFGFGQENWSDNILLYGHNMANNEMFGSLRRYRQDLTYYQKNQFIELDSNYEHATYVICALPITYGGADADWRYWDMEEFKDEEEFNTYMKYARDQSVANITNVDVKYGDKLLTLSTCYSDEDNSRFLVIARKLREGETAETFTKTSEVSENS